MAGKAASTAVSGFAAPIVTTGALNGHTVVTFSGANALGVAAADSLASNATAFSVAVVFRPAAAGAVGANWYQNTGIVNAEQPGIVNDWSALVLNGTTAAAGVGNGDTTLQSANTSDLVGGAHVAIYSWDGVANTLTLDVNGISTTVAANATAARNASQFFMGAIQTGINFYTGDIAEVQMFGSALSTTDINDLGAALSGTYGVGNTFTTPPSIGTLPAGGDVQIASGATLDLNGNQQSIASLNNSGGGGGTVTNNGLINATLTLAPLPDTTSDFGGQIQDNDGSHGATLALTINGSGTQILSGANTFSGPTNIVAGTLQINNANALQNSTVSVNVNNANVGLQFGPGIGTFHLGGLKGSQSIYLADTSVLPITLDVGGNNASTTYSGMLSGPGGLTKSGSGTLTLAAPASYSGATVIGNGTLQLAAPQLAAVPTGTVAYYSFENSATLLRDLSGNGNDLSVQGGVGSVAYSASGPAGHGGSATFNGSGGHLTTASGLFPNGVPTGNSPYTISAWVNVNNDNNDGIVGWGTYGTNLTVNAFRTQTSSNLLNYWWGGGANDFLQPVPSLLNDWHYVTVTYDANVRSIYVDGVLQGTSTPGVVNNVGAADFAIGSTNNGEYFGGSMADVLIANTAFSQAEIQSDMNGFADVGAQVSPVGHDRHHFRQRRARSQRQQPTGRGADQLRRGGRHRDHQRPR